MSQAPFYLAPVLVTTDLLVVAILVLGIRLALRRTQLPPALQVRSLAIIAVVLISWYGLASFLSAQGVFQASTTAKFPALPFAVFLPIIFGLWLIFRSRTMVALIDATPLSWLVAIQSYRVIGAIFLVLFSLGLLPGAFAFPAGKGDMLTGILAVFVAWRVSKGGRMAIPAAYAWNILGILDFVVALTTGFLSSPGPFQMLALDQPNLLGTAYPLVMIPAFLVPLSSILHGACLWKLQHQQNALASGAAPTEAVAQRRFLHKP
jgi:hypothetical protein